MRIQKNKNNTKVKIILLSIAVLAIVVVAYAAYNSSLWPFTVAKEQSEAGTDKNDSSSISTKAEDHIKNGGSSGQDASSASSGGVSDTGGKNVTKQSGGVSSASGNITLYTPTANQKITNTVAVSGASKLSKVYYRINDTVRGMIDSGQLSVNDGYFSGNLSVSTTAKTGTFEVYSFNSQGREVDNISIEVRY